MKFVLTLLAVAILAGCGSSAPAPLPEYPEDPPQAWIVDFSESKVVVQVDNWHDFVELEKLMWWGLDEELEEVTTLAHQEACRGCANYGKEHKFVNLSERGIRGRFGGVRFFRHWHYACY